ncbi:hypothetical protein AB1Y20_003280 [Prymnesium parvum]|uniref:Uncharacterized protein n=1 Tax=Prymnesium parvum TaxID=97485 RepID=A0AB34JBR2_PRYPA
MRSSSNSSTVLIRRDEMMTDEATQSRPRDMPPPRLSARAVPSSSHPPGPPSASPLPPLLSATALHASVTASAIAAIARSVCTLLGPQRTLKCTASEPAALSSDALALLDWLTVEHPAGLVLLEACETLHAAHGGGVTTLVCLVGALAPAVRELCAHGFATHAVLRAVRRAAQLCCARLDECALPVLLAAPWGEQNVHAAPPPHEEDVAHEEEAAHEEDVAWFFTEEAPAASAEEALSLKERGNALLRRGALAEARACYDGAVEAYEALHAQHAASHAHSLAVSLSNRALLLCKMGRAEAALADAVRAVRLDATYRKAHHREGAALELLGRHAEAAAAFRRAAAPPPPAAAAEAAAEAEAALGALGAALSHGAEAEMRLAVRCGALLGAPPWRVARRVHVQRLVGAAAERSAVLLGWVHALPRPERSALGAWLGEEERRARVALLDADLDGSLLGDGAEEVVDGAAALRARVRRREELTQRMASGLSALGVRLLLVRGGAEPSLAASCAARGVGVVCALGPRAMAALADALGAAPLCDCRALLSAAPADALAVRVRLYVGGVAPAEEAVAYAYGGEAPNAADSVEDAYLCVRPELPSSVLTTVLACGRTEPLARETERRFLACLARLQAALQARRVLPGAGVCELLCVCCLEAAAEERREAEAAAEPAASSLHQQHETMALLRREAMLAFAGALRALVAQVLQNAGDRPADAEKKVERALERWRSVTPYEAVEWCGPFAPKGDSPAFRDGQACPLLGLDGLAPHTPIYDDLGAKKAAFMASVDALQLLFGSDLLIVNQSRQHPTSR